MRAARSGCPMHDEHWPAGAYAAEFSDEPTFVAAVVALRKRGYGRIVTYTPYPIAALETDTGAGESPLPKLAFAAALTGGAVGYWIQWYTNAVSYPLNIGGRPAHAVPAFFIPTFEGLVLCAALATFLGAFALLRLPRPWHPMFEVEGFERASIDRFWVAVDATDPQSTIEQVPPSFQALGALRIEHVGVESESR